MKMTTFIQRHERKMNIRYMRVFKFNDNTGCMYTFDCDREGNIEPLHENAQENYNKCLDGIYNVTDKGVEDWSGPYTQHAVIICEFCSRYVELYSSWANDCECGAIYNSSGQRLAPRSQWFDETGENESDVFNNYDPEAIYQDTDIEPMEW